MHIEHNVFSVGKLRPVSSTRNWRLFNTKVPRSHPIARLSPSFLGPHVCLRGKTCLSQALQMSKVLCQAFGVSEPRPRVLKACRQISQSTWLAAESDLEDTVFATHFSGSGCCSATLCTLISSSPRPFLIARGLRPLKAIIEVSFSPAFPLLPQGDRDARMRELRTCIGFPARRRRCRKRLRRLQ